MQATPVAGDQAAEGEAADYPAVKERFPSEGVGGPQMEKENWNGADLPPRTRGHQCRGRGNLVGRRLVPTLSQQVWPK